jgi:hypothetical protein
MFPSTLQSSVWPTLIMRMQASNSVSLRGVLPRRLAPATVTIVLRPAGISCGITSS